MLLGKRVQITVQPGTNPEPDNTELNTLHYTDTQYVRFTNGRLRKDAGWSRLPLPVDQTFLGGARTVYSYRSGGTERTIIGTNMRLYSYQNGALYNITPVVPDGSKTTLASDPISTITYTSNDPFRVNTGSKDVILFYFTDYELLPGDTITVTNVSGTQQGIPDSELNGTHTIRGYDDLFGFPYFTVTTAATGTTLTGGSTIKVATKNIIIADTYTGIAVGDRVKIAGATGPISGVPATDINKEHIIKSYNGSSAYVVEVDTESTGNSSGGGSSVTRQEPISSGELSASLGLGFGGGRFGVGLFGVAKTFVDTYKLPRIWSMGRFGDDIILCPGNGTGVYIWDNDLDVAPTALSNAPTQANWVFVSNNIVGTFGDGGNGNRFKASDTGDATVWTPGTSSNAYVDDIEGIEQWISQASVLGTNLFFTENEVWEARFVGKPDLWVTEELLTTDGILGPLARREYKDSVYWVGQYDFYVFDGASVKPIQNNTLKEFFFQSLNRTQRYKVFTHVSPEYNEVWFIAPLGLNNEPSHKLVYNVAEGHWTLSVYERTGSEEPYPLNPSGPIMVYGVSETVDGSIYRHEYGTDADGAALEAYAVTNYSMIGQGDMEMELHEIWPDSTQTGSVDITVYMKPYAQSPLEDVHGPNEITATTEKVTYGPAVGRQRKIKFSQDGLGEDFKMGRWFEVVAEGTP